ncbi:MAG: box type helicase protein [Rhizobium sp.]|nr:box type helicase protein [Rhizobium sp.]
MQTSERHGMTQFEGIEPALAVALEKRGYSELTPVQKAVLDSELHGADALVSAQTGSGKTVAFGLAFAPTLLDGRKRFERAGAPLALAIAPTRELAMQVARELEWLYEETGAVVATCVGGMDIRSERRALERGAHIIVGTPGRLRDHITRNALNLGSIKAVVLDEADEMLDLGFREDLEFILEASPQERRTLMFSATVPKSIAKLAESYQRNAVRIATSAEQRQHVDIEYRALVTAASDRDNAIVNVLRYYEAKNALVFCNTRAAVNHLTSRLHNRGFTVVALSGELSQNERSHALQSMRDGRARVCIATDVAARGIDLPNLELVIHADLPTNPETLLHRSGRTGRAGRKGVSAVIISNSARRKAERLLQAAAIRAEWAAPPSADEVNARDDERLISDEIFDASVREEEQDAIRTLLEKHGADKIAAAFVRLYRGARSAPEDLIDIGPVVEGGGRKNDTRAPRDGEMRLPREESPRGRGADFGPSVWVSLSVGRKQNAEPRWLIPVLCRSGNITKNDIGAIKMQQDETFVEIAAESMDNFLHNIGPNKTLERGMRVSVLEGMPDMSKPSRAPKKFEGERKPFADKKPYEDRKPAWDKPARETAAQERPPAQNRSAPAKRADPVAEEFGATNTKKKFGRKPEFAGTADRGFSDKPGKDWGKPAKPGFDKPRDDRPKKNKPKSNAR